jgi:hypothetical protein
VNAVEGNTFEILLVPTGDLAERRAGERFNIEADQMARYGARSVEAGGLERIFCFPIPKKKGRPGRAALFYSLATEVS